MSELLTMSIMLVAWANASRPLFSRILFSLDGGTMVAIRVIMGYRYPGSLFTVSAMSASGV